MTTESIKIAELHRTNIDYERQRHLANWLIKSGPHMNKAPPQPQQPLPVPPPIAQQQPAPPTAPLLKNGTINHPPPLYFVNKSTNQQHGGVATINSTGVSKAATGGGHQPTASAATSGTAAAMGLSRSTLFNSQSHLPLQIMTSQEGHKPKLRRFNSNDTSANMFSVADFENARLARRNEIEIKKRQLSRYKMNSLSSGTGDCSTGDSKGSKLSSDSFTELLQADLFLDRFSLPRVVRVTTKFAGDETIQSSSSQETFSSSGGSSSLIGHKHEQPELIDAQGELFLLFRQIKDRKVFHAVSAKGGATSRKKGYMIPQEFQGFFSMVNDKGANSAMQYTTLVQLVRERVYKFLSVDNMPAYTETQNADTYPPRMHYVKGTARGGQVFRLLAVFEDGKHDAASGGHSNASASHKSSASAGGPNSFREKEKGRYAQLLNENRQVVYVSLTTKGKFYELEPSTPQIFQKPDSGAKTNQSKALNTDCVHRIGQLFSDATSPQLPTTIRYIAGPQGTTSVVPDLLTVTKITTEHVLVACPIEETECRSPLHLRKLPVVADMQFIKCLLGYENEQKMFLSPNVQNMLKFCQLSVESFLRLVEMEHLQPNSTSAKHNTYNGTKSKGEGLKILRPLNFPRLLRREKSMIAHEKEDSIIFLSKNDLENLDNKRQEPADKMKVFQPTKKKQWFRSKSAAKVSQQLGDVELDAQAKRMSIDRYQDMSKLLHERFGSHDAPDMGIGAKPSTGTARPSSEIGVNLASSEMNAIDMADLRQKSMSLQDMDTRSSAASSVVPNSRPDLVPVDLEAEGSDLTVERIDNDSTCEERSLISFSNQQSFISEKLFNQFHVKTKQHSKSSSHLHSLLHFTVPQKMNISETSPRKSTAEQDAPHRDRAIVLPPFEYSQMSIEDEMPYSNVRDTLIDAANNAAAQQPVRLSASRSIDFLQPENIYSEICAEAVQPIRHEIVSAIRESSDRNAISSSIVNGGAGSTIRISVAANTAPQSLETVFITPRPSTSAVRRHDSFVMDNIYNTLK